MIRSKIGAQGKDLTYQADFPEKVRCNHCNCNHAKLGITVREEGYGEKIAELYDNKKEAFWLHDCVAIAVYFCPNCSGASVRYNQA